MSFPDVSNFIPWAENGARQDPGEQKVSLGWVVEAPAYQFYNWWQNRVDSSLIGLMSPLDKWDLQGVAYASEGSTLEGSGSFIYGSPFFETSADNVSGFNSPGSRVFGDEVFLANSGGAQVEGSEHFIFGGGGVQAEGTRHVILNSPGAQISGSSNCVIGVNGPGLPEDFTRVAVLASPAANFNSNPHQQAEDVLIAASVYSSFNGIDAQQSVYLASVGADILGGSSHTSVLSVSGSGEINSSTAVVLASSSSSDILDSSQSHIFSSLSSSLEEAYSSYISGSSSSSIVEGTRASIVSSSGCHIEKTSSSASPVQSSIIASGGSSLDSTYLGAILASSGSDISQGMGHAIVGSGGSEIDGGSHSVVLGSSSSDITGAMCSASLSSIGGSISGGSNQSSLIGTSGSTLSNSRDSAVIASEDSEAWDALHSAVVGSSFSEVAGKEEDGDMVRVEGAVVLASRGVSNQDPYSVALGWAESGDSEEANTTIKFWSQTGDASFAGHVEAGSISVDGREVGERFLGAYTSLEDLETEHPEPPIEGAYAHLDTGMGPPRPILWSPLRSQWYVSGERRPLSVKPTLSMNFREGEYEIYEPEWGLTKKPINEIFDVTRASGETILTPTGRIATVGPDTLPLAYVPETGGLGAQIYGQVTNLLLWSEDFTKSEWNKGNRVTVEEYSPSGSQPDSINLVVPTEVQGRHWISQNPSITQSVGVTFSAFFKASGYDYVMVLAAGADSTGNRATIDLQTGEIINNGDGVGASIKLSDGWYFFSVFMPASDAGSIELQISVHDTFTTSLRAFTGDGESGVYMWGAQLTEGSTLFPYVKTEASTVTKPATNVVRELGEEFNPGEGTLLCEFIAPEFAAYVGSEGVVFGVYGSTTNRFNIELRASDNAPRVRTINNVDGAQDVATSYGELPGVPPGEVMRVAVAFDASGAYAASGGNYAERSEALNGNPDLSRFVFASRTGSSAQEHIRSLVVTESRYVPRRLTQAELIEWTRGGS